MQTKQATKQATKTTTKQATKQTTLFYKGLLAECLAGKFGAILQRYFVRAIEYHTKQKTNFPRAQCAGVELLDAKSAREFLIANCGEPVEGKQKPKLEPGNKTGQRLFDAMMVESKQK